MDFIGNRLDRFLSTAEFGGLEMEWGYDSCLYHYTRDAHLDEMRRDLKVANMRENIKNGEVGGGFEYLRTMNFSTDGEIWNRAVRELPDLSSGESVARYWTLSLCREGRSQTMWETYSTKGDRGQPCVMTFCGKDIYEIVQRLMEKDLKNGYSPARQLHFFLPCFYQPQDRDKIARLASFITGRDYYGVLAKSLSEDDKFSLAKDLCVMFALMVKTGDEYSNELETRLVLVADQEGEENLLSFGLGFDPIKSVRYAL